MLDEAAPAPTPVTIDEFWSALEEATDPGATRPRRSDNVQVARLEAAGEPYYVLKQPETHAYLRLSEEDYVLWWQMDGKKRIKDLLFYSLVRFRALPIGRLNRLVADLRAGSFLTEAPSIDLYGQIDQQLTERTSAEHGRRILHSFFHSEWSADGLDRPFANLLDRLRWAFSPWMQFLWIALILVGGALFGENVLTKSYTLVENAFSVVTLIIANLVVLGIHEMAHGLTVKRFGYELNRGGLLIYWGFPAAFVDTRDTWMAPKRVRLMVSWAGPYSGLILGGLAGILLWLLPQYLTMPDVAMLFFYQVGFIGFTSAFVNMNPLLELDGYFMLMDWLDVPNLRPRAFAFWRRTLWQRWHSAESTRALLRSFSRTDRVFVIYGALALAYSIVALGLAIYFWQSRLAPLMRGAWAYGVWGRIGMLLVSAVILGVGGYYIGQYALDRMRAALDWLARRDLLARPELLTILVGVPLLLGVPLLWLLAVVFPANSQTVLARNLLTGLVHVAALSALVSVARLFAGSRFQWVTWSLAVVPLALGLAWVSAETVVHALFLLAAGIAILAAGVVAWQTVKPSQLTLADQLGMVMWLLLGSLTGFLLMVIGNPAPTLMLIIGATVLAVFCGLATLTPLLVNFWGTRFMLPWLLLTLAIFATPWLLSFPQLHLSVAVLWLLGALVYWLVASLAQFQRIEQQESGRAAVYSDSHLLLAAYDQFKQALFDTYEAVFGGRRLTTVREQVSAVGPLSPNLPVLMLAERCQTGVLLMVDRLDDLAGAPLTLAAGRAAYDSLPWLEAETFTRYVLSETEWGGQLARGFVQQRDVRRQLVQSADIFAGFDHAMVDDLLAVMTTRHVQSGELIAEAGQEATAFYLVREGRVAVMVDGTISAELEAGGYFGTQALAESGVYSATYVADSAVELLVVARERFDPLWRADTLLASQVQLAAQERDLLKRVPLFSGLSPQQLATIGVALVRKTFVAGETLAAQGSPRTHLFIVAEGQVDVWLEDARLGRERWVGSLGQGEHFGEYALFADTPYSATYRASTDVEMLLLDEPTFDKLAESCEVMSHYIEQIGTGRQLAVSRRAGLGGILA